MDKATIEAMRVVIDMHENSIKHYRGRGQDRIHTLFGDVLIETLRLATEGFRTLVDQAEAEQRQAPAEPDGRDVLTRFVEDLEDAVASNYRNDCEAVSIFASGLHRTWKLKDVRSIVGAINGLTEAKPTTTAEPTLEDRVAAINRAEYLHGADWCIDAYSRKTGLAIPLNDVRIVGDWLIEREKAEAKGGS